MRQRSGRLSPSKKMPLFNVQWLQQKHLIKAASLDEFAEKVAAKFQIGSEEVPKYYSTDGAQITDFEVFEVLSENSKTCYPTIIVKLDSECKSSPSSQSKGPCIMTKAAAMNYEVPVNRIKAHHALHDALTSKRRSDVTNALTSQLIRIITEDLLERYGYDETGSKARDVIATALIQKYPNLKLNECDTGGVLKTKLGRRVSNGRLKRRLRESIAWHQIMEGDQDLETVREKLAKMIIEKTGTDGQKSEMAKKLIPLIDRDIQIYWVQGKLPGASDSDPVVTAEIIYQRYPHLKKKKFLFKYYKEKTGKDAKEFVEGEDGYSRLLKTYKYLNHYAKSDRGRDNKSLKYHKDLLKAWCGDLYDNDTSKYDTEKAQRLMVTLAFLSAYFGENLEGMIAAYNTLSPEDIPDEPKIPVRGVCLVLVGEKSGCPSAIYVSVHRICTVKCSRVEDGFAAFFVTHYLWGIDYLEDSAFTMTYFQKFLCELTPAPFLGLPEVANGSAGIKKGRKKVPKTHKAVNITKMDNLMAKVGEYRFQDERRTPADYEPPGFMPAQKRKFKFSKGKMPTALNIRRVATKFHGVKSLLLEDGEDSLDKEMDSEPRTNESLCITITNSPPPKLQRGGEASGSTGPLMEKRDVNRDLFHLEVIADTDFSVQESPMDLSVPSRGNGIDAFELQTAHPVTTKKEEEVRSLNFGDGTSVVNEKENRTMIVNFGQEDINEENIGVMRDLEFEEAEDAE